MRAPAIMTLKAGTFLKRAPKIGTKTITTTGLMESITPNGASGPNIRNIYLGDANEGIDLTFRFE